MKKNIGFFSPKIIELLGLDIPPDTPIYISDTNIEHMKASHPTDFERYGKDIENIIAHPDYVGRNQKDHSIEFTKEYAADHNFVKIAVRVTAQNVYYARSIYILNSNRVRNFITKGTLKKLDK